MEITVLIEDSEGAIGLKCEHGLSLYVKTDMHNVLVDTGSSGEFIENAGALGIDVKNVDVLVLTHGHYDHGGGIMEFARINPEAKIYMQKTAGGNFRHGDKYIGLDKDILSLPGLVYVGTEHKIDHELSIFSRITGRRYFSRGNMEFIEEKSGVKTPDSFSHEQCLVINNKVLISGCAHNGILNILDRFREIYGCDPEAVISGFHMVKKFPYTKQEIEDIKETAKELAQMDTMFYTGHCTGDEAFAIMKPIMKSKLHKIHTGSVII